MATSARGAFRTGVFARDGGRCVVCATAAVDAHHLLERRLWPDGGYRIDNGVALCAADHLAAERTVHSAAKLRELAGIERIALPPQCDPALAWDKWGNPYLPGTATRCRGELFLEEPVQLALRAGGGMASFAPWALPVWRPTLAEAAIEGVISGPRVAYGVPEGCEQIAVHSDAMTLRVPSGGLGALIVEPARGGAAALAAALPPEWRIEGWVDAGGQIFAESIWDGHGESLSWESTLDWLALLELAPPLASEPATRRVLRSVEGFSYRRARQSLAFVDAAR